MVPIALIAANNMAAIRATGKSVKPLADKDRFNMLAVLHLNHYLDESLFEIYEAYLIFKSKVPAAIYMTSINSNQKKPLNSLNLSPADQL